MSRQKERDADPKAIQQIHFVDELKNPGNEIVVNESRFILRILENILEKTRLKFSQESVTVLQKMTNYQGVRVKPRNTQLNKLKSAVKNKTVTISRINKKNF